MYLDTDIILALIKPSDWLRPHVALNKITDPRTSVFALAEAELILEREFGRNELPDMLGKIRKLKIRIENVTEVVIEKNLEMLKKYPDLRIFDSIHAAFCYVHKEKIISTDHVYDDIKEIERIDPRNL